MYGLGLSSTQRKRRFALIWRACRGNGPHTSDPALVIYGPLYCTVPESHTILCDLSYKDHARTQGSLRAVRSATLIESQHLKIAMVDTLQRGCFVILQELTIG